MKIIKNAKVFDGEKIIDSCSVVISEDKIVHVSSKDVKNSSDTEVIDAEGRIISPGFIDMHIHGAGGYDVMDGCEESVLNISSIIASKGTTSFLPTTMTMDVQSIAKSVKAVKSCMGKTRGANILGIHLEGPFINKEKKGAQNEKYILKPDIENYNLITAGNEDIIKRVTIAPEVDEGLKLTRHLASKGICVSVGHTCAGIDAFSESVKAGVNLCTHLFNAMSPLSHRDPGVPGGALLNDDVYVEFIADMYHIHKDTIRLILKCKDHSRCILISDAMHASCKGDGVFLFGGQEVTAKNGQARLANGALAGSVIMVHDAIRNMVNIVGVGLDEALAMATLNAAKIIGVDKHKGRIAEGYDADIVMFDDSLDIKMVMVMGETIHQSI